MTYKMLYKCRRCGETFYDGTATENWEVALQTSLNCALGKCSNYPLDPTLLTLHECEGNVRGSMGVADFMGYDAKENN